VDVSMCEGALAFMLPDLGNFAVSGVEPTRGAEGLNGGTACYGVYRTRDGRHLSVGGIEPKFWAAFNQAIGRAVDFSELVAPPSQQERVRAEVQAILANQTRDEWEAVFAGVDACVEPVLGAGELRDHPQHRAREVFFTIGEYQQTRTPLGARGVEHRPPPRQGEHTVEILGEAGFTATEIAALQQSGAAR
jgi:crotonobetainyl-CoA:carnitine CoA-transferase CaiB-like acyl-CoA transferase